MARTGVIKEEMKHTTETQSSTEEEEEEEEHKVLSFSVFSLRPAAGDLTAPL